MAAFSPARAAAIIGNTSTVEQRNLRIGTSSASAALASTTAPIVSLRAHPTARARVAARCAPRALSWCGFPRIALAWSSAGAPALLHLSSYLSAPLATIMLSWEAAVVARV
jgi:hypothetical protein